jgi:hypothetical protein
MYLLLRNIKILLLTLLPAMVTLSCSKTEDEPCGGTDVGARTIIFTLSFHETATRATTWGEDYDPSDYGTAMERRIDFANVAVEVCDPDSDTPLARIPLTFLSRVTDNAGSVTAYKFTCAINETLDNDKAYKLAVRANYPDGEEEYGIDYLRSFIPMWGFTTVTFGDLDTSRATEIAVSLVRAAAKVEISMSETSTKVKNYQITNVALLNVAAEGHCSPSRKMWRTFADTRALPFASSFNPLEGDYRQSNGQLKALPAVYDSDKKVWYAYIPERDNTERDDHNQITEFLVTVYNSATKATIAEIPLEFVERGAGGGITYDSDGNITPINIIRNHYYQFVITAVSIDQSVSGVTLNYTITDSDHPHVTVPDFE